MRLALGDSYDVIEATSSLCRTDCLHFTLSFASRANISKDTPAICYCLTMKAYQAIALFSLVAFSGNAVPAYDEVTSVPNINFVPNFRHYSGYLEANQEQRLHYWSEVRELFRE